MPKKMYYIETTTIFESLASETELTPPTFVILFGTSLARLLWGIKFPPTYAVSVSSIYFLKRSQRNTISDLPVGREVSMVSPSRSGNAQVMC